MGFLIEFIMMLNGGSTSSVGGDAEWIMDDGVWDDDEVWDDEGIWNDEEPLI
jgi:hypothetical protein